MAGFDSISARQAMMSPDKLWLRTCHPEML